MQNKIKEIHFSSTWNNKLLCHCFTTIRLSNQYERGDKVKIFLKENHVQDGVILDKRKILLDNINEFIARLDTGYSADETKEIIKKMYKEKVTDWQNTPLYIYLIKADKTEKN